MLIRAAGGEALMMASECATHGVNTASPPHWHCRSGVFSSAPRRAQRQCGRLCSYAFSSLSIMFFVDGSLAPHNTIAGTQSRPACREFNAAAIEITPPPNQNVAMKSFTPSDGPMLAAIFYTTPASRTLLAHSRALPWYYRDDMTASSFISAPH